ncbi:hypothetical protein B0A54_02636 [Friedmanniomyces endolithicus]|uniref:Major facilitator superfamily (MFS) profile domain-containing protein n=2 Tax=Dothideomycetidae TaxID=451867 RepID=A0A4U0VDS4_9PEZI|nr:hypothetical protein LTS09_002208 [Friedmanniomyces endolithicus]TKA47158.1 hypothetical protein B0A54_02636 [Friedmanniomyces endolithicus]
MDQTQLLSGRSLLLAVIALNLANAIAFADITSISSVSAAAAKDLKAEATINWATTSALVAATIGQCLFGYLSDIFGRRPMLYTALVLYMVGCLGCGGSHFLGGAAFFYVCRAVTGCAVGSISNLVNIAQNDFLTSEQRGRYQGVQGVSVAVGSLLGLLTGAAFSLRDPTSWTGWPLQYLLQVMLAAAALVLIRSCVPPPPARSSTGRTNLQTIDWAGMLFGTGAIVPALIGATEGNRFGWDSKKTIALFVCSAVCSILFFCFGFWEPLKQYGTRPIVPFRLFRRRAITIILLQCLCSGMAYYTFIVHMPQYLETIRHQPKLTAALLMTPYIATHGIWSSASPWLMERVSGTAVQRYKVVAFVGFTLWSMAMLVLSNLYRAAPIACLVAFEIMVGLGTGSVFQNSVNAIRSQVTAEDQAAATSARNVVRYLGGAIATAIGTMLSKVQRARVLPEHLLKYVDQTFAKVDTAKLSAEDIAFLDRAHLAGTNGVLLLGGVAVAVGAVSCFFLWETAASLAFDGIETHPPRIDSAHDIEMGTPRSVSVSTEDRRAPKQASPNASVRTASRGPFWLLDAVRRH